MSLAATLAAAGGRPASFLPAVKCSSCGDEIEISSMEEHACNKAAKAATPGPSNPYMLKSVAQPNDTRPAQPSPLQFNSAAPPPSSRLRAPTLGSSHMPVPKPPRTAPPRVNTDAANLAFLGPPPRPRSPASGSPVSSKHSSGSSGFRAGPPMRSLTSPMPRSIFDMRPPSPEMSSNLDCAFPPFPPRIPTSGGRKTSVSSGHSSSRSSSRAGRKPTPDLYSLEPNSPRVAEHGPEKFGALKSALSLSSLRRPSNDEKQRHEPSPRNRRSSMSKGSSSMLDSSAPEVPPLPAHVPLFPLPPTAKLPDFKAPNFSQAVQQAQGPTTIEKKLPPERPARPAESLTPSLIEQLQSKPLHTFSTAPPPLPALDRSQTLPVTQEIASESTSRPSLNRMQSEPALRSSSAMSTHSQTVSSVDDQPESSRQGRGRSKYFTRIDRRLEDAPPVPKPVQIHRSDSRHRPNESGSSTASSLSSLRRSNSSSQSPIVSAASSIDTFSATGQDAGPYGEEQAMRVPGLTLKPQVKPAEPVEQVKETSPLNNITAALRSESLHRSLDSNDSLALELTPSTWPLASSELTESPQTVEVPSVLAALRALESPMDPALVNSSLGESFDTDRSTAIKSTNEPKSSESPHLPGLSIDVYDPSQPCAHELLAKQENLKPQTQLHTRQRSRTEASPSSLRPPMLPRSQTKPDLKTTPTSQDLAREPSPPSAPLTAPPIPESTPRPNLNRRSTTTKPTCRGCAHPIEGKSVKAVDGRLTGRWHKSCFVCKTCQLPFTTADFYVIANNPYCEQHYHEKNGSVCHACHRGIEGQFLETTGTKGQRARKYHRRCFTCVDCRTVLAEDYFEIAGRVFCERHALAAMRSQARKASFEAKGGLLTPHGGSALKAERRTTRLMEGEVLVK